ncbi:E3 ubiquitin-protein ligase TRIM38-like [Perognathus longimembris pacificus]|uniref:E3 ubiquitin-protein ligase TRIM38-like n=1 Tax=Perognathus longimembris pacificus TaxID=214514 RepID=UPI00201978E7|nr:E3 ubiquitin-protein ligase TRIM38-like [Perognathus longimembris pacificus]XP_048204290.1 E3 ubiquitin-protein ligase TRIM38-like [Perognathus longimembris pacificus]XP_048204291.1 E3 ubiquitin-protein ligase TRIM38-like [Perognathus longimembris pacificus]
MASFPSTKKMRDIATCPICMNLMTHPVSIKCGHNFCQLCIVEFFNRVHLLHPAVTKLDCPLCRGLFDKNSLRPNKELENIIEVIKEMEELDQEVLCKQHGEKLHLFCEDEGQLICWRCERSEHQGHATALVEEVYQGYKEQLQNAMVNLNQLQEECLNHKVFVTMQMNDWKEEINIKRQKIRSDFKNLRSFLHEEEKSYIWKLEKEEEQMLKRMRSSETSLEQKSNELKSHILELEAKCQGSVQNMLQGVKDTLVRSSAVKLENPENFSLEIHTMCNVSELYFDVKKTVKRYQVSVTLDPSTAHPDLLLSDDRRQVTRGCSKEYLEVSSKRFTAFPCVLGCEGFTSGRHYFEVDVGEGTGWDLGVCLENVQRGTDMRQEPEFGFWTIRLCKQIVALTSPPTPLHLNEQPLVVGIFVDYEAGVVSFYNMTTGSHMFTFPRVSFSDTLLPYFQVYQHSPLFLPPPDE